RSTSGSSVSACQTETGATPVMSVSARIMSRSRFDPGKVMTADFMWASQHLDGVVLDHGVGEELFAHGGEVRLGGFRIAAGQHDVEHLALAHAFDTRKAECGKSALDRLALGVENAGLQRDCDACLHRTILISAVICVAHSAGGGKGKGRV